jgi:hypothetical protein
MKKKVKIYENEIKRATRRKLMENYLDEQHEMRDTYSREDYISSPRERGVRDVFGKYGEEIPPSVLRYMRKNPAVIIKRLHKLYGNEIFDSVKSSGEDFMAVDAQSGMYGPFDRDNDGIASSVDQDDDGDGMLDLNVDVMSEVEQMDIYTDNNIKDALNDPQKSTFGYKNSEGDIETLTKNESTRKLFKKFLNSRK